MARRATSTSRRRRRRRGRPRRRQVRRKPCARAARRAARLRARRLPSCRKAAVVELHRAARAEPLAAQHQRRRAARAAGAAAGAPSALFRAEVGVDGRDREARQTGHRLRIYTGAPPSAISDCVSRCAAISVSVRRLCAASRRRLCAEFAPVSASTPPPPCLPSTSIYASRRRGPPPRNPSRSR